jgi:hypothetical protein
MNEANPRQAEFAVAIGVPAEFHLLNPAVLTNPREGVDWCTASENKFRLAWCFQIGLLQLVYRKLCLRLLRDGPQKMGEHLTCSNPVWCVRAGIESCRD